jgi:hypothetical protein
MKIQTVDILSDVSDGVKWHRSAQFKQ